MEKRRKEEFSQMISQVQSFGLWFPLTVVFGLAFFIATPIAPAAGLILLPIFLICAFRLHSIVD